MRTPFSVTLHALRECEVRIEKSPHRTGSRFSPGAGTPGYKRLSALDGRQNKTEQIHQYTRTPVLVCPGAFPNQSKMTCVVSNHKKQCGIKAQALAKGFFDPEMARMTKEAIDRGKPPVSSARLETQFPNAFTRTCSVHLLPPEAWACFPGDAVRRGEIAVEGRSGDSFSWGVAGAAAGRFAGAALAGRLITSPFLLPRPAAIAACIL